MLKNFVRKAVDLADGICALLGPRAGAGAGTLVTLLFHSLYRRREDLDDPRLAPNQHITKDEFRRIVGHVLDRGYTPVAPAQVDAGLPAGGKYVMVTFDDGYYNNTLALDTLERFDAPATFFISTDHVLEEKAFWWDALNRELARTGTGDRERRREIQRRKLWTSKSIESDLKERFGAEVMRPRGELDRPFTRAELRDFASHRLVHLGNHTCDHAILTNCTREEIAREIRGCQQALADIAGSAPIAIAYPNGDYSRDAIEAARRSGLRIGVTVRPFPNRLPLTDEKARMTLGRFMPCGGRDIAIQWRKYNSEFVPSHMLKMLMS